MANTIIRITGSSAFRANINNILKNDQGQCGGPFNVVGNPWQSTSNQLVFQNQTGSLCIKTSFTSSEAGLAALGGMALYDNNNIPGQASSVLPGTPLPVFLDTATGTILNDVSVPDVAMADTSPGSTFSPGVQIADQGTVGIVPFVWMKGVNNGQVNWTNLSNLTSAQIAVLLAYGQQNLSFFTGKSADSGASVVMIGRNLGSGTRANALLAVDYGLFIYVQQYAVSPVYVNGLLVNASNLTTHISDAAIKSIGNDGFNSGSGVANTLLMTPNGALTTIPISYLSLIDAATVQTLAAAASDPTKSQYLTLNGVPYSDAAVVNGTYDFWGHEHLVTGMNLSSTVSHFVGQFKMVLVASMTGGVNGISVATMLADRPNGGDTGYVAPL